MRGTRVKQLRAVLVSNLPAIRQRKDKKTPFKNLFKRLKKAYMRGDY